MKVSRKSDKFLWVGNDPAIDFVNTLIVQEGHEVDLLEKSEDLQEWVGKSRLPGKKSLKDLKRSLGASRWEQAFHGAKVYRTTLRMVLSGLARHGTLDSHTLEATNQLLGEPRMAFSLRATQRDPELQEEWIISQPEDVSRPFALAFARLVTGNDLGRIRKCQNPECVLFFLDTSKSGTRAWCSMNICGNKLRVAAFRKRQAGQ